VNVVWIIALSFGQIYGPIAASAAVFQNSECFHAENEGKNVLVIEEEDVWPLEKCQQGPG
jgi:hypothetical protein